MSNVRLIFEEPPEDVDETWVHGAMLGGMAGYDNESLSHSYFAAAHSLVSNVLASKERGQEFVCPILYLYRHAIELSLKVVVPRSKLTHDISTLMGDFRVLVQDRYREEIPDWFTEPISQLADFDSRSDVFRYGADRTGAISFKSQGELWVDLRNLRTIMERIERGFQRVAIAEAQGIEALAYCGRRAAGEV